MALQQPNNRSGQHHCRDCGVFFESSKSLEVHLQYHKENLLTKWANQAAASTPATPDSENNNTKNRRDFQNSIAAPADSTEMKSGVTSGPGRPNSTSGYPPSPFTHPQTPASYGSAASPYQNEVQATGPSPSSTSFGFTNPPNESYQIPYNGYPNSNIRSPHMDNPNFIIEGSQQQEQFILGGSSDFPSNMRAGTPNSPSSSTSFRYNVYNNKSGEYLDKNGVSSSSPNTYRPQSPHQCEKCGFICDSQTTLAEHIKTAHSPSPTYQTPGSAFQTPETYYRQPASETLKSETNSLQQESPDILDLDSQQKVHNFRSEDEPSGITASPNPHSISSMLSPWSNNVKPQYPIPQPYHISSTNQPSYPQQNGTVPTPPQHTSYPTQTTRGFPENFTNVPQQTVPNANINSSQIPNSASPKLAPNSQSVSGKGDSWKSNEARRPKTYNCSACNKWFTSSGHLKRHYNTTLHKNAVKQSGQPDPATLPISSHHHPNRDPTYILSSKTPPGMNNPPPNLSVVPKTKKAKAISPQVETNSTPSPALSNANTEGDSSRSNDNIYERVYDRTNGGFERTVVHQQSQPAFGNGGFEMLPTTQTSAFDRTTPGSSGYERPVQPNYEQRTTPQNFDRTTPVNQTFGSVPQNGTFENRTQNGFGIQELNRPSTSPTSIPPVPQNYDYYRDYNRIPPIHNQVNSTNQLGAQPPNSQAGPSASPSGGLPICPPSLLFLRTPNPTTYMGENTTSQRINEQPLQQQDHHTIQPYTSNPTITGNFGYDMDTQNTPLPSFSNFQNNSLTYSQNYLDGQNSFLVNSCTVVPKNYYIPVASTEEYTNEFSTDFPSSYTYVKVENKPELIKLETLNESFSYEQEYVPQNNVILEGDVIKTKVVKEVSEKECQTSFHFPSLYSDDTIGFRGKRKIKREDFSDSSPPNSPQEIPSSTILEITETVRKVKKRKRKMEESSNMVTSTGSPQPVAKRKDVIRCEQCDKTFNRICYLTQHNKSFHCGDKPFKCDRCGKRFHSESRAKDHSKKHGGEKPYKCDICPKSFNHKTDLRRHLCLHTGQKPFPCQVCGKGFIRKDHMLKHFHTHKTGKKKFLQSLEEIESDKKIIQ